MILEAFHSQLVKSGSKVILPLPFDPNEIWGQKERHHIHGTIQGIVFRGEIHWDSLKYFLAIGPAWLRDSGVTPGQVVEVILDAEGPQTNNMNADISAALTASPRADKFFESLPTFYRNNYVRWIESAKRPETRQARIRELIQLLEEGKRSR